MSARPRRARRVGAVLAGFALLAGAARAALPASVDLRSQQTPVKAQGSRGNCFIFATVAAMEAEYLRQGFGALDLAEHYSDYVGRMFFLETVEFDGRFRSGRMRVPPAGERETGLPLFEMIGGTVDSLVSSSPASVLGLPEERYMPFSEATFDPGGRGPDDAAWRNQFDVCTHLFDERRLPRSALQAPAYYRVQRIEWLPKADATRAAALEAVLAAGHEVIWDFRIAGNRDGRLWRFDRPAGDVGAHRMLLVGYDRRDPQRPFFIAKNSWGHPAGNAPGDEFTYLDYGYLQYGEWASWLAEVARPERMPELRFIGRWRLAFGTEQGVLDVYHRPGLMQPLFDHDHFRDEQGRPVLDRRIGTYYPGGDRARPHRVNGSLSGDRMEAWIDFEQAAPRWDVLRGSRLALQLDRTGEHLAGRGTSPDGRGVDAQATRVAIPSRADAPAPPPPAPKVDPADPAAAIRAKWEALGGAAFLGKAVTGVETCPDGQGRYTHYENGSIYWSPATPACAIYGDIRAKWAGLGWERGALGYPACDERDTGDGGRENLFQHGRIVWYPNKGAWEDVTP